MMRSHRNRVLHLLILQPVIHPDGNIWMVDVVESSGSHSLGMIPGPGENNTAKTTPLPTRDTDIHARYLRRQNDVDRAENPGHASGTDQCSGLSPRFSGRLVSI